MPDKPEVPPSRSIWLVRRINYDGTREQVVVVNKSDGDAVEYVPASALTPFQAILGKLVMMLMQDQFQEARELALQIPLEFPDGAPMATDQALSVGREESDK